MQQPQLLKLQQLCRCDAGLVLLFILHNFAQFFFVNDMLTAASGALELMSIISQKLVARLWQLMQHSDAGRTERTKTNSNQWAALTLVRAAVACMFDAR